MERPRVRIGEQIFTMPVYVFEKVRDLPPGIDVEVFFEGPNLNRRNFMTTILAVNPTEQVNNQQVLIGDPERPISIGGGTVARVNKLDIDILG